MIEDSKGGWEAGFISALILDWLERGKAEEDELSNSRRIHSDSSVEYLLSI